MSLLYDIFFIIFAVVYIPYLLLRRKAYGHFMQRLGFLPASVRSCKNPIWIHAVSVGEASLALDLAAGLKQSYPHVKLIVSTTTETGNDLVASKKGNSVDGLFYFPLDLSFIVSKVICAIQPKLFVMIETEIWPNLLSCLGKSNIPVVLANGRISDNSYKNYRKFRFIMKPILMNISRCCVQTAVDRDRIASLGVLGDRISVTGNMKFDSVNIDDAAGPYTKMMLGFAADDRVLIAGSTHHPEEIRIIDVFKSLKIKKARLKMIIAPRHIERSGAIEVALSGAGIKYVLFSDILNDKTSSPGDIDVVLVDTIGHLKDLYALATVIFIGGSLVPKGGQNPIEGASLGKPIVAGPHMFNFREITRVFLQHGAMVQVSGNNELYLALERLLDDGTAGKKMGDTARKVIVSNKGAIERTIQAISVYLEA